MLTEFACPVCDASRWEPFARHVFRRDDRTVAGRPLTAYELLRRRVLFEVWHPGADAVELTAVLCGGCGFATFTPRPSVEDIDAKYRFLQEAEGDIGGSHDGDRGRSLDARRAQRTFRDVVRVLGRPPRDVMDFGGGDGKLLVPFHEAGATAALVDYNVRPLPGVHKLGDTLDDVPDDARFDAIVCSHVLEHLADPADVVRRLARHLAPDGVLFAEVPLQLWEGIPVAADPVTHPNFFGRAAFEELFRRTGYAVARSRSFRGSYGAGERDVLVVVARPAATPASAPGDDLAAHSRRLLQPGPRQRLERVARRRLSPAAVGGRMRRLAGRA